MLKRVTCLLALIFLLVVHLPAPAGSAATCAKGYHWVETSVSPDGPSVFGSYTDGSGYCAPNNSDDDPDGTNENWGAQRVCNMNDPDDPACAENPFLVDDIPAIARSLVVRLQLPPAKPIFGPDPNNNEWKMLAVGFPVWLTTAGPRHRATTASAAGLTFRLSADLVSTRFSMGDGSTLTCSSMTSYSSSVKAGSPSPTCGHTYTKPSLPKGSYTVTATPNWMINWSVDGISGRFPLSYSDSAQLPIGELQALNR